MSCLVVGAGVGSKEPELGVRGRGSARGGCSSQDQEQGKNQESGEKASSDVAAS